MMKKKNLYLSILTGLLLIPCWMEWGHGLFSLIALIPLLFIESDIYENKHKIKAGKLWLFAALSFVIWNTATTWWIWYATGPGAIAAIIVNTCLMSTVFWFFHITKRRLGKNMGYFALILYWLTFEYFYFNTEISWPWLTLGHAFNYNTKFIQWYDSTGVLGGSVWILLSNIVIFNTIKSYLRDKNVIKEWRKYVIPVLVILVPIIVSFVKYYTYKEKTNPKEMVVLQPNIDPYEKFIAFDVLEQTMIQLRLAEKYVDENTDYIVGPETSINNSFWIEEMNSVMDIIRIKRFLSDYPQLKYIVGAQCYNRVYGEDTLISTSKKFYGTDIYYQSHNAAFQFDSTGSMPYYFKSELVVGVEKEIPGFRYFNFLKDLVINLGGTVRGWTPQEEREVFFSPQDSIKVGPIICWESVFGEFVTDYIKKGANYLFVITNDGWWKDTPGYKQHNALSRIRAIETRRSIARSANTGISSFIDQRGNIITKLGWWRRGAIKAKINANDKITFYVKHGDYIGRIARFFTLLVILTFIAKTIIDFKVGK